jgi:hypothetical protein
MAVVIAVTLPLESQPSEKMISVKTYCTGALTPPPT